MKKTRIFLLMAIVMLLAQACKKNSTELGNYMGTAICASENFTFTTPFTVNNSTTPAAVDLRNAPYYVSIKAEMSEAVSWTVTIKGQTSGATKTFTAISDKVNVKWYGNCDGGEAGGDLFFVTGEQVDITIEPACRETITIPLTISHSSNFNSYGTLMVDFDFMSAVYKYNSIDPNIGPWVRNIDTLLATPSPQGGNCHKMYGPAGHTGWYIGGFGQAVDLTTVLGTSLVSDSVYINLYVYGTTDGSPNNTTFTLDMVETVGTDDYHFKKSIPITWSGWKLLSYKLSELYIGNPIKVKSLDVSVGPGTYNGRTEGYFDFIIFTKGKPFTGIN